MFTKWYGIQGNPIQKEEGGDPRVKEEKRLVEPAASQRGDGHLLRINNFTRGPAPPSARCLLWIELAKRSRGYTLPRDRQRRGAAPAPQSTLLAACAPATQRFPECYRKGKAEPKSSIFGSRRQLPGLGPAPLKQSRQLGAPRCRASAQGGRRRAR